MTTLIVGCGYLGRRVGRALVGRGERVVGTTRSAARAAELTTLGIEPVVFDVLDTEGSASLPAADRLLYCVGYDRASGVSLRQVYVDGLRAALGRLGPGVGRLVYTSSTGVYGRDDGGWVDEASPTEPRTESGRACLGAEGLILDNGDRLAAEVVVLRLAGLYGPGRMIRRAALERGEPIAGDPGRILNLIHIDDAATAAVAAMTNPGVGRLYNVADDRPAPRREYYERAAALLDAPAPRFEPVPAASAAAAREEANKRVSNERMKAELGVALAYPDIATGLPAALAIERRDGA